MEGGEKLGHLHSGVQTHTHVIHTHTHTGFLLEEVDDTI